MSSDIKTGAEFTRGPINDPRPDAEGAGDWTSDNKALTGRSRREGSVTRAPKVRPTEAETATETDAE